MTLANRSAQNAAAPNELDRAISNALRSSAQIINATRDTYDCETGNLPFTVPPDRKPLCSPIGTTQSGETP